MCQEHGSAAAIHRLVPRPLDDDPDVVPLEPVDGLTLTTLVDNVSDMLLLDQGPAKRVGLAAAAGAVPRTGDRVSTSGDTIDGLHAEHGFSMLVTVDKGDHRHHLLFDTGMTPTGMAGNMRRLGIEAGDVEAVVLSHGHFDHTMGLDGFVQLVGRANVPALVHPGAWARRRLAIPGRDPFELPTTSRSAVADAGFEIVEAEHPSLLFDGSVLITGEVPRTTPFETGLPFHEAHHGGAWEPDPLILDDQALIVHVRHLGLVVLTGCGHAGVVNILRWARRLTGVDRVHAVVGGFHLSGPLFEPVIGPTVDALADLEPSVVVPAHCTGWRAVHTLARRLPDAFIQNSVGTRFELTASA